MRRCHLRKNGNVRRNGHLFEKQLTSSALPPMSWRARKHPFSRLNAEGFGDLTLNLSECVYLWRKKTAEPFKLTGWAVIMCESRAYKWALRFNQTFPPLFLRASPMKINLGSWHLCVEKLSIFSFSSSGRYIKTWTDWFRNVVPSVSSCSR